MRNFAVYAFFLGMFAPAMLLLAAGAILVPMVVIMDLLKGHFETMLLLLPLIGGAVGLSSAIVLTTELAGSPIINNVTSYARLGLMVGIAAECVVYFYFEPEWGPSFMYWLPPIVGAVVLFAMSFSRASKNQN